MALASRVLHTASSPSSRTLWEITRTPMASIHDLNSGEVCIMLRWARIFFVVALVAAVLGFTGIALAAAGIAKILF